MKTSAVSSWLKRFLSWAALALAGAKQEERKSMIQVFETKNLGKKPDVCNAEDAVPQEVQIEEQNKTALLHRATSNQTQLAAVAGPNTQYASAETMDQTQQVDAPSLSTQLDIESQSPQSMTKDDMILNRWVKITIWATTLAGTSLVALAAADLGSENTIPYQKHVLLAFFVISICISFTCGVPMLVLWVLCHRSPNMTAAWILMLGSILSATVGVLSGVAFFIW